jgi:spermidine synthase
LKKTAESATVALVVATGTASVVTQLVLIREFLSLFQGNEIVIAQILFSWMVLGGAGSLLARPAARPGRSASAAALAWLCIGMAPCAAGSVLAARLLRDMVFLPGSSVGFYPGFLYIFAASAPYALLVGFLLPFSLFVLRSVRPGYPGARVYIWDNAGDVAGGALFAFLLVSRLTPLQALGAAHLPLLCAAVAAAPPRPWRRRAWCLAAAVAAALALLAAVRMERASLAPAQGTLVDYRESRYGRLTVVRQGDEFTVFHDGQPSLSSRSETAAEESVHYAMAQVEAPRRALLIAAASGVVEELKKYGLEAIDYVELDPAAADVLFEFNLLTAAGLDVIHRDGRAHLAETGRVYDAVLVNLADPDTFQVNRFFTARFFDLARSRLSARGVLGFSMEGFDNYPAEPLRRKLSSVYNTVKARFRHVMMLPGRRVHFVCSDRPLRCDIPQLLAERGVPTVYIRDYFDGDVTAERIAQLKEVIDPATPANTDLFPYLMKAVFEGWFHRHGSSPLVFIAALAAVLALYLSRLSRPEFVLFTTGWTVMGGEVLVIFAFQIFFGYVYVQIGAIVTAFLAGMLPGAWLGLRLIRRASRVLLVADAALLVLLGALFAAVHAGDRLTPLGFLALGFAVSFCCGVQFPSALHLRADTGAAAAGLFSADLIGAAFGTLATSTVLIPYFGIIGALAGLAALKLLSLLTTVTMHEGPFAQKLFD